MERKVLQAIRNASTRTARRSPGPKATRQGAAHAHPQTLRAGFRAQSLARRFTYS